MPVISQRQHHLGFTLLEVMLVLLLIGLASGYVVFNAFGTSQSDNLSQQARRFQVIVDMASDYAVLNQQQLGIRFEEKDNQYYFVYLDGEDKWQVVEQEKIYQAHTLPDQFSFTLNLDDLPWEEEDQLFDRDLFDESLSVAEDGVDIGNEEKPIPPPQVLIMSSGEITPFTLTFNFEDSFDEPPVYFVVSNRDIPPLEIQGPLERPPL